MRGDVPACRADALYAGRHTGDVGVVIRANSTPIVQIAVRVNISRRIVRIVAVRDFIGKFGGGHGDIGTVGEVGSPQILPHPTLVAQLDGGVVVPVIVRNRRSAHARPSVEPDILCGRIEGHLIAIDRIRGGGDKGPHIVGGGGLQAGQRFREGSEDNAGREAVVGECGVRGCCPDKARIRHAGPAVVGDLTARLRRGGVNALHRVGVNRGRAGHWKVAHATHGEAAIP